MAFIRGDRVWKHEHHPFLSPSADRATLPQPLMPYHLTLPLSLRCIFLPLPRLRLLSVCDTFRAGACAVDVLETGTKFFAWSSDTQTVGGSYCDYLIFIHAEVLDGPFIYNVNE